jgi:hypothetical protein
LPQQRIIWINPQILRGIKVTQLQTLEKKPPSLFVEEEDCACVAMVEAWFGRQLTLCAAEGVVDVEGAPSPGNSTVILKLLV